MQIRDIHVRVAASAFALLCTGMMFSALMNQHAWEAAAWAAMDEVATYIAFHLNDRSRS